MKGGFQILDLSGLTVGTEAAVNNAFKTAEGFNNKAILVLPPSGGSVYCQLNKSSDNYVGAYVGADGATYNIVIKPNNNVTVTKTEAVTESELTPITSSIMSIGGQVEDLQTDVNSIKTDVNNFKKHSLGTAVGLTDGSDYSVPSDGIVVLQSPTGATNEGKTIELWYMFNSSSFERLATVRGNGKTGSVAGDRDAVSVFVKKGMTIRAVSYADTSVQYTFMPDYYPFV